MAVSSTPFGIVAASDVASGPTVIVSPLKGILKSQLLGTAYAGVRVDSDGDLYEQGPAIGTFSSYETWLDSGLNSEVWVLCSVVSGSVSGSATATRLACTSDRTWTVNNGGSGTTGAQVDLQFYDAASGGNLLDVQTVTLTATDS